MLARPVDASENIGRDHRSHTIKSLTNASYSVLTSERPGWALSIWALIDFTRLSRHDSASAARLTMKHRPLRSLPDDLRSCVRAPILGERLVENQLGDAVDEHRDLNTE